MVRTTNPTDRTEVDHARVSVFKEDAPHGYPMVVPTGDDVSTFDLGDLVADRIEANGRVTMPDDVEAGDRVELGVVYWDNDGIPTRLVREDDVVVFTEDGGFDRVVEE